MRGELYVAKNVFYELEAAVESWLRVGTFVIFCMPINRRASENKGWRPRHRESGVPSSARR